MGDSFIPPFHLETFLRSPWEHGFGMYGWSLVMGFLVTAACGLVGNYLILRRMALVGDAISHSVLPGLVIAFLVSGGRASLPMFTGAVVAGIVTTLLIEFIHKKSRVKQDAAIGIVFSSLFAFGVILVSLFASKVDLDQDCVLYGDIGFVGLEPAWVWNGISLAPWPVLRMGVVLAVVAILILLFYKELLVSSFDPGIAATLGIPSTAMHYGLMTVLSVVVVSAFESAGAILVVAMLIIPGATASLLVTRLPARLLLTVGHAAVSALAGLHLAVWLSCSMAAAMVVAGAILFTAAWGIYLAGVWIRRIQAAQFAQV